MLSLTFAAGIIGLAVGGIAGRLSANKLVSRLRAESIDWQMKFGEKAGLLISCRETARLKGRQNAELLAELYEWRAKDSKRRADAKRASAKGHEVQSAAASARRHERMDKADTRLSMKQAAE